MARGGKRDGSGRKYLYGEQTEIVRFSVPVSKVKRFKKLVEVILSKWIKKKPK
jgi:hypothetical protein